MSELKLYKAVKATGVEWLTEVPQHWSVQPATAISRVITSTVDKKSYEGELPVRLCNYTDVYYNDVIADDPEFMKATATAAQIAQFTPRAGDVPITKDSETSDDIGIPAYVPQDLPGVVYGYHLAIYRPWDVRFGRFLKYLFDSRYVKVAFENKTPGVTRVGLSQNTMKYLRIPVPPVEEAVEIADYLDHETAEIDAFIESQQELITLLNERRSTNIAYVVTKGLNPEAPLKETGIEWLGKIPKHWQTHSLKYAATTVSGVGFPHKYQGSADEEYAFHKVNSLSAADPDGVIRIRRETVSASTAKTLRAEILPSGSIVLAKIGAALLLGRIRTLGMPSCIDNNMLGVKVAPRAHQRFVYYALHLVPFPKLVNPGAIPSLSEKNFRSFELAWPPRSEQLAIAEALDRECSEIDAAIDDARRAISLSKERRAAVITAAATGKIDVRNWKKSRERALDSHGIA